MNCKVKKCTNFCKYKSYQLCNLHYQRFKRLGNTKPEQKALVRNGKSSDYAYTTWANMKTRCLNKKSKYYKDYGGRGIGICKEWLYFDNFKKDMGERPIGATIERIDNSKGYYPENVIWADMITQANNRRNNVNVTINNETHTVAEWARISGISSGAIYLRLRRGWMGEKLLSKGDARYKSILD